MTYEAQINRSNPTVFLFLVDQSGSMGDKMPSKGISKAQFVADVLNRSISDIITRCTRAGGIRNYFEIGVIGYGGDGPYNGFKGELGSAILNQISSLEANPLRIEQRNKKMDDGAGGLVEQPINFPIWFEPNASGGTPMCQAITKAAEELATWCDTHPNSYPPTVLHITDGESTDGNPEDFANQLRQIKTDDGPVLLFNLHVSSSDKSDISFPVSEFSLPDVYAQLLFRMSSPLPEHLIKYAQPKGVQVGMEARGFIFNADSVKIAEFFDIGTKEANLER
jgi:hypothetical protein